jgi:hypothetical protein
MPQLGGGDDQLPNLLVKEATEFDGTIPFVVAAITPLNKSLKIRVIGSDHFDLAVNNGWSRVNNDNGFTIVAQRENQLVSGLVYLAAEGRDGSATIEYYEDSETPTFTKQISWTGGWMGK